MFVFVVSKQIEKQTPHTRDLSWRSYDSTYIFVNLMLFISHSVDVCLSVEESWVQYFTTWQMVKMFETDKWKSPMHKKWFHRRVYHLHFDFPSIGVLSIYYYWVNDETSGNSKRVYRVPLMYTCQKIQVNSWQIPTHILYKYNIYIL